MLVRIFDTNNWVRIILENNPMGMRALWNEVLRQKEEKEFKKLIRNVFFIIR